MIVRLNVLVEVVRSARTVASSIDRSQGALSKRAHQRRWHRLPKFSVLHGVAVFGSSVVERSTGWFRPSVPAQKPSTWVGSGKPLARQHGRRDVVQWVSSERRRLAGSGRPATTNGSRVPPRWLAICLPHCNRVLLASPTRWRNARWRIVAGCLANDAAMCSISAGWHQVRPLGTSSH